MNTRLTKYNSFEEMKRDVHPASLSATEKTKLDAEVKQMAELLKALRAKKRNGSTREQ
jgi:hypothetical protein